jgi:crotonobetainyl-CoA:carnitine CoA-transferase CaiB-like acyl-CoA transferase
MQFGVGALCRLYETADGWLCIAVVIDRHWAALVRAVPELDRDDFGDAGRRADHEKELVAILEPLFRTRSAADWFAHLDSCEVPCEVSSNQFEHEMFDDPEMRELSMVVSVQHPQAGRLDQFGATIDFSDNPMKTVLPPPLVGEHTRQILIENGLDDDEVNELIQVGAIHETLTL